MSRLLIVDDNQQNLHMLDGLLCANGFQVERASNGAEALERARCAPPDMIVSDVLMPVMDGFALCRSWKEDERLRTIPFVFYTATYTDPKDEAFALGLGADRFIAKPIEPDEFMRLLVETMKSGEPDKPVSPCPLAEEAEYYKQYSAALVRKLEDKMLQLEEANRILEHDAAERKRVVGALLENERELKEAQRIAHMGSWSWDVVADDVQMSEELLEIFGFAETDGRRTVNDILERIPPEDRDRVREALEAALRGDGSYEAEFRVVLPDREPRIVHSLARVECDDKGKPLCMRGACQDITRLRAAEQDRDLARRRLETALRHSNVGLYDWDLDTNEVYLSPEWKRQIGYEEDEIEGSSQTWEDCLHPDDREPTLASLRAYREGEIPEYAVEFRLRHKDGSYRWIYANGEAVRDEQGRARRMLGCHVDITQRKQAEEERRLMEVQLQHTQRLESLGVLAGGIAHDFNNLLTTVLGQASLVETELPSGSPLRESIEMIQEAAQRAAELTSQMLAYAGKGKFAVRPVDLSTMIKGMSHLLTASLSKKTSVVYQLADDLPAIEADAAQLQQVVMNLVVNGSEAIGDQPGVITVSTSAMTVDGSGHEGGYLPEDPPEGTYVRLEVTDGGCGMDEETKAKIFDPFFTTKRTGRGLGLSAMLGIVQGHHGAIRVGSTPGVGTTFDILLPTTERCDTEAPTAAQPPEAWQASGTVLVVDDESPALMTARMIMERTGFAVLAAEDGRQAVEIFRERGDDIVLVLLDLTMPEMSGEEAYREIRGIRPDVRVILASGYAEEDVSERSGLEGVSGFIKKPYRPIALIEKLREVLGE